MKTKNGFTLVEIAIVLVVIGLLIGGVMAGKNIIRSAELKSVATEYAQIIRATETFREQYLELPGDMTRATTFWSASGNCPGNTNQGTPNHITCNGDGNGIILHNTAGSNEMFRQWQHLAAAGLLEGNFSGVTGPGSASQHAVPGFNVPKSSLSGGAWNLNWWGTAFAGGNAVRFNLADYGHQLVFGGQHEQFPPYDPIMSPQEMYKLDLKIDDGKPARGKMVAHHHQDCTDSGGDPDALDSDYLLSESGQVCSVIFHNVFEASF